MEDLFTCITLGIIIGLLISPIVAGLLWVFSITVSIINFNWIFVGVISFIIGCIIAFIMLS